jgi:hypothetical protein
MVIIANAVEYAQTGFSGLQILLDRAISKLLTGKEFVSTISTQAFPYPPYIANEDFELIYVILLPQLLVLGVICIVPTTLRTVVGERDTGIRVSYTR